jgi:hypothetical protein
MTVSLWRIPWKCSAKKPAGPEARRFQSTNLVHQNVLQYMAVPPGSLSSPSMLVSTVRRFPCVRQQQVPIPIMIIVAAGKYDACRSGYVACF